MTRRRVGRIVRVVLVPVAVVTLVAAACAAPVPPDDAVIGDTGAIPGQVVPDAEKASDPTAPSAADPTDVLARDSTTTTSGPVAMLPIAEYSAGVGQPVTFDASASFGRGSQIITYDWDFDGDSVFDLQTIEPVVQHAYDQVFDGHMQVRVTAADGGIGSHSVPVRIGLPGPVILPAPQVTVTATPDDPTTVQVTWTDDPDATAWLIAVNDVPVGATRDNPVTITDIERTDDVTFTVTPIAEDGTFGDPGTAVLASASSTTAHTR